MTDYSKLVEALRHVGIYQDCNECEAGRWHNELDCCLFMDAAAAIEALIGTVGDLQAIRERLEEENDALRLEPKRGKWIIDGAFTYNLRELNGKAYEPVYRCSCCNRQMESYLRLDEPKMPEDADFPEYCPHCGARMMEVQDA